MVRVCVLGVLVCVCVCVCVWRGYQEVHYNRVHQPHTHSVVVVLVRLVQAGSGQAQQWRGEGGRISNVIVYLTGGVRLCVCGGGGGGIKKFSTTIDSSSPRPTM